jgi:dUTP pyrophosphatase
MEVKIKKMHPDAVIPKYAKPGDGGMDLTCVSKDITDLYISYDIGLSFEIPEGFVGLLFPRSSLTNYHLSLGNHVGVIDSGFRSSISFRFKRTKEYNHDSLEYDVGDRVGQIIILPYPTISFIEVEELSSTERNAGGYGSTGK